LLGSGPAGFYKVPLDRGEGLNVVLYWLGPKDASKPKSRGANHLTAKYASGDAETRTRMHTGAEYELGAVYEARDGTATMLMQV
jgi:hypothetical protein